MAFFAGRSFALLFFVVFFQLWNMLSLVSVSATPSPLAGALDSLPQTTIRLSISSKQIYNGGGRPQVLAAKDINTTNKKEKMVTNLKNAVKVNGGGNGKEEAKKSSKGLSPATIQGIKSVIGGSIAHLTLGTLYCWGNFISYAPSNLKYFDPNQKTGPPNALYVLPVAVIGQCMGMPFSSMLQKKIGHRNTLWLGAFILQVGVFLSSYAKTLTQFMLFYSIMFGIGCGMAYTAPLGAGWQWFPKNKGLVSGAVLTGFGAGGFVFNYIGTKIINPKGLQAVDGVFPQEIYDNFPVMLRKLAVIYFVMAFAGGAFVSTPEKTSEQIAAEKKQIKASPPSTSPVQDAMKTKKFWFLWSMAALTTMGSLSTAGVYKSYGALYSNLNDDAFLSMVGGLAALCNGFGRLFWGTVMDSFGFQYPFMILTAIQSVFLVLYSRLVYSRTLFTIATMAILFALGGTFSMMPSAVSMFFGAANGPAIYGVLFTAFAISSVTGQLGAKQLVETFGWKEFFILCGSLSTIAHIATFILYNRL